MGVAKSVPSVNTCIHCIAIAVLATVEQDELEPDHIHAPGIYMQRLIVGTNCERRSEQRTVRARETA
jgi:3-oxoacid CoA-transferase subunit A